MTDADLHNAVVALRNGELIAYPTEAVWGLGCDPMNEAAVRKLLNLKRRPVEKGLILVAASIKQLEPYLSTINLEQRHQLEASWPGFQTWVVPVPDTVPYWLTGQHSSIALRVSTHPLVQNLCQAFAGPLVSTSANPAGHLPALTAEEVHSYFDDQAFIVPGELGGADAPSSIIDLVTGKSLR